MQLFSTKRNRLQETALFRAPEVDPHAFVKQLLARKESAGVAYLSADSLPVRRPATGRFRHYTKFGSTPNADRLDAEALAELTELQQLGGAT